VGNTGSATAGSSVYAEVHARRAAEPPAPRAPRTLTARQRAEGLFDQGRFVELQAFRRRRSAAYPGLSPARDGDGVVTGWGHVAARPVAVVSHDFSYAGGSIGAAFAEKVVRLQEFALDARMPIVYLNDSGGARIHEGIEALHGCGRIFALNVRASRLVPQISVVLGPSAGAAAYSPALTDWTLMVRGASQMFLTGPEIVRAAVGEVIDREDLGGSLRHTRESGVAHLDVPTEEDALAVVRRLIGFIPASAGGALPCVAPLLPRESFVAKLDELVPLSPAAPYDMRKVLAAIVDDGDHVELMPRFGPSLLTGFARLDGIPVGLVASQPKSRAGILDSRTSTKAARFVAFCGRFGVPILTFVDVPGFLPGGAEERRGVITHGAELLRAYAEVDVPKLTVIVRKAYGGAYIALGSQSLGAHLTLAWPTAELAVMGPEAAVGLLHRRELAGAHADRRAALAAEYRRSVTRPFSAAEAGIVDDVVLPGETRSRLSQTLHALLGDRIGKPTGADAVSLNGAGEPTAGMTRQ
jgi:acetyl-CoA/propionyl-CoA carboxylase carboxyl transferase subunit